MVQSPTSETSDAIRAAWKEAHVSPLWESPVAHRAEPGPERAHVWRWREMVPLIADACTLRSTEAIERRVLSLINPDPKAGDGWCTTTNLNAGLQILMPGESARPHRHSMNALRFVIDGEGASTIVDGKDCPMIEGDLVTTPGWTWHEHIHRGSVPIVWLDVLDASLHRYLKTAAFQPGPSNNIPARPSDAAFAVANIVPDMQEGSGPHSPVFRYTWAGVSAALAAAPAAKDGSRRVRYVNPMTGGPTISLLDCYALEIARTETIAYRSSSNAVCAVMEGSGTSRVGDHTISWEPKDVFTLPHGSLISHKADGKAARIFIATDREIYRRLGLLEEERAV